jgi:succinate-semialdehyde dehydrogenase/glutarate-semialdehyde dehydrogenase
MAYESVNPFTEQLLKSIPEHSEAKIEQILAQADLAYRDTWRGFSFDESPMTRPSA